MNVHEYQAKEVMESYNIPVPKGELAFSYTEALQVAENLGADRFVVKAQVHAGGRGKGGGVKLTSSPADAADAASEMLGMNLVTHQTGPEGKLVRKVWVEEATDIDRELYLAVVLDRTLERLVVMASPAGGMDIEEVSQNNPELIFTTHLEPGQLLWGFQARKLMFGCGLDGAALRQGVALAQNLVRLAWEKEASLVEINPLVVTKEGKLLALDAKINFDDSAIFRHPGIAELKDPEETDPLELKAQGLGLNYIRMQGNVGTMVNGAGLAMATMDVIKMAGAEPANFLDVGGGASEEMVAHGFEIILADPNVRAILINIFGGILRCDVLAAGVVAAARKIGVKVPLVVRLEGTNHEEGARILNESGLSFTVAQNIAEAAQKIAQLAN